MCLSIYMYMYHTCAWCPQRPREDDRSSELELNVVVSCSVDWELNSLASSPAPKINFFMTYQ